MQRKAVLNNMKKFVVCALLIGLLTAIASPVLAWEAAKQKKLSLDENGMQWYILDYGKDSAGVPFAVSRKYYTNEKIKTETIELLMSKYGISPEVASSLYCTEYRYEYTPDGQQYAMTYLEHLDILGKVIHRTAYEGEEKAFQSVTAAGRRHALYQGADLAMGKTAEEDTTSKVTTKKASSTTKKSSTVPAKRVVRARRK